MATGATDESPQIEGDRALARRYANALKSPDIQAHGLDFNRFVVQDIPPNSSFGQWRTHLHDIIQSPAMRDWSRDKGIDLSLPFKIDARNGIISFNRAVDPISVYDFPGWPLLMSAAKALTPDGGVVTVGKKNTAPVQDIGFFYREYLHIDRSTPSTLRKNFSERMPIRCWRDHLSNQHILKTLLKRI
ncbi:hypothetical protein CUU62_26480 [Pseudomonas sp. WP001]|nr:hypothetical protein CUU62_26480 [Pseudomonas sp. WP001]